MMIGGKASAVWEAAAPLIRERLFPRGCAVCGKTLLEASDACYGLCADCQELFDSAVFGGERCRICGQPLISEISVCLTCRAAEESGRSPHFDHVISLFPYIGAWKAALSAYKFGRYKAVGRFFAEKLIYGARLLPSDAADAIWVPVPPRLGKIKREGWDQIDTLAFFLNKLFFKESLSNKSAFRKTAKKLKRLESKSQKELNKAGRQDNLLHRIQCVNTPPKKTVLFDDVFTTGSTINACAAALKQGGAETVYGICLFYTI